MNETFGNFDPRGTRDQRIYFLVHFSLYKARIARKKTPQSNLSLCFSFALGDFFTGIVLLRKLPTRLFDSLHRIFSIPLYLLYGFYSSQILLSGTI